MKQTEILAYLDHNLLDLMTKGDPHKVKELLKGAKLTPVYSNETLKEIHRSKGYENKFLELLEEIGAKYIEPVLDEKFKQTGQARIHAICPKTIYEQFLENLEKSPQGDFGLSEMLMKFYGGKLDASFKEIFESGANELHHYILEALDELENVPEMSLHEIEKLKILFADLPEMMMTQTSNMAEELGAGDLSLISAFEKETGIGPKILNNISPPNVVMEIWGVVSEKMNAPNIDLETFFGIKPHAFEEDSDRELTLQEKVNAIYHQLNFLGYYRDSKMKDEKRFKASFSDMTHAGIASFCHLFLCRDESLVMKAAAAFEYLGVTTKILHYQANKPIQPTSNAPAH
jgi:hypothetical protein